MICFDLFYMRLSQFHDLGLELGELTHIVNCGLGLGLGFCS